MNRALNKIIDTYLIRKNVHGERFARVLDRYVSIYFLQMRHRMVVDDFNKKLLDEGLLFDA